jgi:hypothetical protein
MAQRNQNTRTNARCRKFKPEIMKI